MVLYNHRYEMCSCYCHQNDEEKMGLLPIPSVIHTVTIGTVLNFNGSDNEHGLENVTCKQTFNFTTLGQM